MERENLPKPVELSAQNAYSSGMSENAGRAEQGVSQASGTVESGSVETVQVVPIEQQITNLENTLRDHPNMPVEARRAIYSELSNLFGSSSAEASRSQTGTHAPSNRQANHGVERAQGRGETRVNLTDEDLENLTHEIDDGKLAVIKQSVVGKLQGLKLSETISNESLKSITRRAERLHNDSVRGNDPDLVTQLKKELAEDFPDRDALDEETRTQVEETEKHLDALNSLLLVDRVVNIKGARRAFQLYLAEADFNDLDEDPIDWMERQIDRVYEFSRQGSEMNSPQVAAAQQHIEYAARYMILSKWGKERPDLVRDFSAQFQTRLQVMFQRGTIQRKNMEGAKGLAQNIGVRGIMSTLTFENGLINKVHNRMNELYDDMRLRAPQHHITPDMHAQIQSQLIDEFQGLLRNGIDVATIAGEANMSDIRREKLANSAIRRAVRGAYDHFVASQREAVIVARGTALPNNNDLEGILADPSQLFQMFNYEQLLIAKFGLLNYEQQEFFSALKRRYAVSVLNGKSENIVEWVRKREKLNPNIRKVEEDGRVRTLGNNDLKEQELIKYGGELMKDLFLVNDFYSSPWRLERFMGKKGQIREVMRYQKAKHLFESEVSSEARKAMGREEQAQAIKARMHSLTLDQRNELNEQADSFALFMRLRYVQKSPEVGKAAKKIELKNTWEKIAKYRPEDVVKIFRELGVKSELKGLDSAFAKAGIELTEEESKNGLTLYDKFKDRYGLALRFVREEGFSGRVTGLPEQIDFSTILNRPEYIASFNKAMGLESGDTAEIKKVADLFTEFKNFAVDGKTIEKLSSDTRFEGLYNRVYAIDDALLDKVEVVDEDAGVMALSTRMGSEPAGDAYVRTFNDAENAALAQGAYFGFLRADKPEEKIKLALEAGEAASHYSGPHIRALAFRYTAGSYMLMGNVADGNWFSMRTVYEMLDLKSLPANRKINELKRIFGPDAPVFNHDAMKKFLSDHRGDLTAGGDNKASAEELWEEMSVLPRQDHMMSLGL